MQPPHEDLIEGLVVRVGAIAFLRRRGCMSVDVSVGMHLITANTAATAGGCLSRAGLLL